MSHVRGSSAPASSDPAQNEPPRNGQSNTGQNGIEREPEPIAGGAGTTGESGSHRPPRKAFERGRIHAFKVCSSRFIIDARYIPLKPLGRGAYGVVCSAVDTDTNTKVAIKRIPSAFDDLVDAKRILREVKMLHHFKHENIIGLYDLIDPPPHHPFDDIYIVLDFMETDLHKIIYSKNKLTDDHIQYFMYQALRGLKYIHSAQVIHRDLKPSNLLLNGNCDLKICDFGLARGVHLEADESDLTEYVVTRWYRAPEVMYSVQDYTYQIDVWALGCILAELHGRKPLFPGDDYIRQMNLIFDVIGTPSDEDMGFISNARALSYIRSLPTRTKVPFSKLYPQATPLALDLMDRMLVFNPRKRITVNDALHHPYFKDLRNPRAETICPRPFDFSFEQVVASKPILQQFMWDEIYDFRPFLRGVRGEGRPLDASGRTSSVTGGVPNPDLPPGSGPHAPSLPAGSGSSSGPSSGSAPGVTSGSAPSSNTAAASVPRQPQQASGSPPAPSGTGSQSASLPPGNQQNVSIASMALGGGGGVVATVGSAISYLLPS